MAASQVPETAGLAVLDTSARLDFEEPTKKIHDAPDVQFFLSSKAYADIMSLVLQLNASMFPTHNGQHFDLDQTQSLGSSATVDALAAVLAELTSLLDKAPPEPGPRRFGNAAFRTWYRLVEARAADLLVHALSQSVAGIEATGAGPLIELKVYLLGSFGSPQRLDYGTGHELSFLAFIGSIWKLGGFDSSDKAAESRRIVFNLISPKLIKVYNLEPAGTHGVWGLDDHFFIPYILGSAQLAAPADEAGHLPMEGSLEGAPKPDDVAKIAFVESLRASNLYFDAIGFIYDVKKGPFWEHSPMLYDISGVKAGWAKINKGMIKMYMAEVLSKFPVVQHFPFGTLFKWERDPNATAPAAAAQSATSASPRLAPAPAKPPLQGTAAPWATKPGASGAMAPTAAPWATARRPGGPPQGVGPLRQPPLRDPVASIPRLLPAEPDRGPGATTKAPWAKD